MITGASSGLGASIAKEFARRGDELVLVARRKDLLEDLKSELLALGAPTVENRVLDLADARQVETLCGDLPGLSLDTLINNAALGHWDSSWDTPPDKMQTMIDVNISAVTALSHAFTRSAHDRAATLLNVASGAGYALFEGSIPYSATKFYVTSLTEGIAQELSRKKSPMRSLLLAPGPIATEFMLNALDGSSMEAVDTSGLRFHTPDEVAGFTMELFDSNQTVGMVQYDMSFKLSGGLHPVGSLIDPNW